MSVLLVVGGSQYGAPEDIDAFVAALPPGVLLRIGGARWVRRRLAAACERHGVSWVRARPRWKTEVNDPFVDHVMVFDDGCRDHVGRLAHRALEAGKLITSAAELPGSPLRLPEEVLDHQGRE